MPDDYSLGASPVIKIGGSPVSTDFMDDLGELTVALDLHLPSMFTIRVADQKLTHGGGSTLDLGKEVQIGFQPRQQGSTETGSETVIFKGEITALEPEYGEDGRVWLNIRGYDKGHRLHRGKKSRTFLQKKDSDLISTIAGEAGLSADAETTSVTYPYILQNNQTNWEFLQERAQRLGFWLYVDGVNGKLCFKKPATPESQSGPTLTWGDNLYRFSPSLSAVHQSDKIKVYGWDDKKKEVISSEVTPAAPGKQAEQTSSGGAAAKKAFTASAEAIVVTDTVITVDDAKAVGEGLGQQISRNFLWADGQCLGDPTLVAGKTVNVVLKAGPDQTTDSKFGGNYLVTAATHHYDGQRYWIDFSITGQDPYTFSALLGANAPAPAQLPGVATAVVTNLNDPDKLGRVKVKYPWLGKTPDGADLESDWVRLSTPMAGAERGFLTIPEVNDEVLVAFEHGNPDFPFVVGALWSNTDKPPVATDVAVKNGKVVQRVFKSRTGHIITVNDTDGEEKLELVDKSAKESVVIDSKAFTITVKSDKTITIEAANGDIVIKGKNVTIESQQNTTITAKQNFSVDATQAASMKAKTNITLEATAQLGMKGTAGAKLESPAMAEVSTSGILTLKGSLAKIN